MNKKNVNIILWVISLFFAIGAISGLLAKQPGSWSGIFLLIPAALFNPNVSNWLSDKFNLNLKWWMRLSSILIPMIIIGAVSPISTPVASQDTHATTSSPSAVSSNVAKADSASSKVELSSGSLSTSTGEASSSTAIANNAIFKAHYIDVGQGDSEFLELPNGQTMLIDAGNPENGSQIVNYIKGLGHSKIDYLIATHPHSDHIGGMAAVVKAFNIGTIYMPKVTTTTQVYEELLTTIQSKGLKVNSAKAGINVIRQGNLNVDIIAPVGTSYSDLNQYSAVIKIIYDKNSFLFMGDAGTTSEEQITANVKADVLKVGHHGSNTATSSGFLSKVSPKYAVIEVGKDNSYGHPADTTLAKLKNAGINVYRTDECGTIIFTSDGNIITVDKNASSIKEQAPPTTSSKATTATDNPGTITAPATGNDNNQSVTVYITDTGKKYHCNGCKYLSKSKHAISLSDAKAEGYEPCSVCHPPQ